MLSSYLTRPLAFAAILALGACAPDDNSANGGADSSGNAAGAPNGTAAQEAESSEAETTPATPPFGGPEDVAYAGDLWEVLTQNQFVGPESRMAAPYEGQEPHGAILITLDGMVTVNGHEGRILVKKNYLGENVTVETVSAAPRENLDSITVMFMREEGYDDDHDNWYWAKYNPDGALQTNPNDMKLAGRVAKGMDQGCIACHRTAPGGDYIFTDDL